MVALGQTLRTNSALAQPVVRCWSDSVLDFAALCATLLRGLDAVESLVETELRVVSTNKTRHL